MSDGTSKSYPRQQQIDDMMEGLTEAERLALYDQLYPWLIWDPPMVCGAGSGARPSEPKEVDFKFDRDVVVPLLYGRKKIEGIPIPVGVYNGKLYVCYIFCEGEIEGFEKFFFDDLESTDSSFSGLFGLTGYTGTLTQTYDPDLHECDSDWVEPLTGTAYATVWFKADEVFSGIPKLSAVVKGRKVYDHRTAVTAYSSNPVLCLVDLKQSQRYGGGVVDAKIDWTLADNAANDCDVLLDTDEPRYSLNYYIRTPTNIERLEAYILMHFNGDLIYSEGRYKVNLHKSRAAVATFDQDEVWGVVLGRPEAREVFNRVRASYTVIDTWQEDEYSLETEGLAEGDELLSETTFDFTGCSSISQVRRLSIFQLNAMVSDLRLEFETYNTKGLERFDRFAFSHDIHGLVAVDFYVLKVNGNRITAIEYSEDLFSDALIDNPDIPEADLPSPLDTPDPITNLNLVEDLSQAADSHFSSSIIATWTASATAWVKHYEVWLKTGGDYRLYGLINDCGLLLWTTGEDVTHYVKIIAVSEWGRRSSAVEESILIEGKNWPPTWPAGAALTGVEAGDVAILSWGAALDRDTVRYEICRGHTTDTWESAAWVATIDALNYFDRSAPAGTWKYFVKAIDAMDQYSAAALSVEVEVTVNPNLSFNRDQAIELTGSTLQQVALSPSNSAADQAFPLAAAWDTWAERFVAGTNWDDSADAPWPIAPTSGTIDLVTAATDMGGLFTGEFTFNYTATKIGSGTATLTPYLMYSENGTNYTTVSAASAVTVTARYIKAKFVWTCAAADTFYIVSEPVTVNVKAQPVVEFGNAEVTGSETITFNLTFTAIDKIMLTPQGTTPVIALADNVSLTGFDIKLYDTDGVAETSAIDVYWKVEGV